MRYFPKKFTWEELNLNWSWNDTKKKEKANSLLNIMASKLVSHHPSFGNSVFVYFFFFFSIFLLICLITCSYVSILNHFVGPCIKGWRRFLQEAQALRPKSWALQYRYQVHSQLFYTRALCCYQLHHPSNHLILILQWAHHPSRIGFLVDLYLSLSFFQFQFGTLFRY